MDISIATTISADEERRDHANKIIEASSPGHARASGADTELISAERDPVATLGEVRRAAYARAEALAVARTSGATTTTPNTAQLLLCR